MRARIIAGLALLCAAGAAQAQSKLLATTATGERIWLAQSTPHVRVGSGTLVRVIQDNGDLKVVSEVLVSCTGVWISDARRVRYVADETPFAEVSRLLEQGDPKPVLATMVLAPGSQVQESYAKPLLRAAPDLCRTARPEPRNVALPVASGVARPPEPGTVMSILTGTVERKGSRIDLWVRNDDYTDVPIKKANGEPLIREGKPMTTREVTGAYQLSRYLLDCEQREARMYHYVDYKAGVTVPTIQTVSRSGNLQAVVPDTLLEGVLEAACRIY